MERLDKIWALVIAGFVLWVVVLLVVQFGEDEELVYGPVSRTALRVDPELDKKIVLARRLLDDQNLEQADRLLAELVAAHPREAMPHFLKGELSLFRRDPIDAMLEYRKAVDLNPAFLDKDADLFQGAKIKKTVEEAKAAIEKGLAAEPGDPFLIEARKTYYYMVWRITHGCR